VPLATSDSVSLRPTFDVVAAATIRAVAHRETDSQPFKPSATPPPPKTESLHENHQRFREIEVAFRAEAGPPAPRRFGARNRSYAASLLGVTQDFIAFGETS